MSSFVCEQCGRKIIDTEVGYVTGCEHYPVEDILRVCGVCRYNWSGHCIKGNDDGRYNIESLLHVFGCEDFEEKE